MYWNYNNEEFVFGHWPEAEDLDEPVYYSLMSTSNALCVAYAPPVTEETGISDSFKLAEIFMARDIWNQSSAGNRSEFGPDGLPVSITRLNYLARDLLRPKRTNISRLR